MKIILIIETILTLKYISILQIFHYFNSFYSEQVKQIGIMNTREDFEEEILKINKVTKRK